MVLLTGFPREVLRYRRQVNSVSEFNDVITANNGRDDIYCNLYDLIYKSQPSLLKIDKLFFDFDEDTAQSDAIHVHEWCQTRNIKHLLLMSGRGFHVYIFTIPKSYKCPKSVIRNAQMAVCRAFSPALQIDKHVVGDLAQITRLPNSFNVRRGRYCIPLTSAQVNLPFDAIVDISQRPATKMVVYGSELLDLDNFVGSADECEIPVSDGFDIDVGDDELRDLLPPCVLNLLSHGCEYSSSVDTYGRYKQRFVVIAMLRDLGFSKETTTNILRRFLSEERFHHCVFEERQIDYLYARRDIIFPSCGSIKKNGLCPVVGSCEQIIPIYA